MLKDTENKQVTQDKRRDSFVFYRSFFEAIDSLPEETQLNLFKAISNYSLNFVEPKLSGLENMAWTLIKPQLDANIKKWANGCKGGKYGIKGGRPKTTKKPQENPNLTPNGNVKENGNAIKRNQIFLKDLKENENEHASWAEGLHMQLGLKLGKLPELLKRFCGHLQSNDKEHESLDSFKQHFRNWLFTEDKLKRLDEFKKSKVGMI